ncbi:FUSC family protein [Paracidobacterium acidisoli]|uniref:FUSC family protein n=1 Tax=Paracidobacterium acidisoli TaxID=2303751 RepID=A0A372IL32_9BACT|nr:FUSC family protein [Paracidobacterium acidisoli]MBT9332233.1 FUSC family protein [Paracidobacterium acidisoli]
MSSTPVPSPSAAPSPPPYLTDSYIFHWDRRSFRADLIFVLPIALCLTVGILIHHPSAGMIAAGGAMTAGFGAKQSIDDSRLLPMIFVTLGMTFAAFLGVFIGHGNLLLVFVTALWGFGYGMLTTREAGYSWVGQQCVVTFLVASAFPASFEAAAARALLIFAGGVIQLLISSLLLRLFRQLRTNLMQIARYVRDEELAFRAALRNAAQTVREGSFVHSAIPYSLRLAVTLGLSTEIYHRLHFSSGYWIPMTALLVLKPSVADTASRAVARVLGTLAGAILLSFCLAHISAAPAELAVLTVLFAWLSYGTLNVNYALFTLFITGYIVFLLSLNSVPGPVIAERRAICTVIGGSLALFVRLIVIFRRRRLLMRSGITA